MNFKKEVQNAIAILSQGKTILYPTDTIWGIGCDATDQKAIKKIYKIKARNTSKALICLMADNTMVKQYISNYSQRIKNILNNSKQPTTLICKTHLDSVLPNENGTVAIRIPKDNFCHQVLKEFGKPIVSTSANISGQPHPKKFSDISPLILDNVDYAVTLCRKIVFEHPSRILNVENEQDINIIRT